MHIVLVWLQHVYVLPFNCIMRLVPLQGPTQSADTSSSRARKSINPRARSARVLDENMLFYLWRSHASRTG